VVIDFHVHAFPDNIAIKAMPSLAETANTIPYTDGTVSGVLDSMKTAGVDKSCILSIATKEGQTEKITDWAHNINSDFNNITAFGSVHPEYKNFKSEIKRMKSLGIKGVKFHPDYQMFFVDDKKMYPIYKELIENEMIIVFHAGLDIGLPAPYHCTPLRLKKVLDAFPDNKIIAAHMGGFSYWDDVEKYLMGTKLFP
jgi:predicted TIM-barrel fold metal-dependent hydrolase